MLKGIRSVFSRNPLFACAIFITGEAVTVLKKK